MRSLGIVAVIAGATLTSSCKRTERDLPGVYAYEGSAVKATLELHQDGTYKFCGPDAPCELGKYRVESLYDRIFFYGNAMIKFTSGGWTNVSYDGLRCPCIFFLDEDIGVEFRKVADEKT